MLPNKTWIHSLPSNIVNLLTLSGGEVQCLLQAPKKEQERLMLVRLKTPDCFQGKVWGFFVFIFIFCFLKKNYWSIVDLNVVLITGIHQSESEVITEYWVGSPMLYSKSLLVIYLTCSSVE